ncbi:MAG: hypothetical protein D6731_21115 [Planctomycetota bacterium]|nr:MAG: hypothetical protein D6731_21115 [Planctomycetota bacterium]
MWLAASEIRKTRAARATGFERLGDARGRTAPTRRASASPAQARRATAMPGVAIRFTVARFAGGAQVVANPPWPPPNRDTTMSSN